MRSARDCSLMFLHTLPQLWRTLRDTTRQIRLPDANAPTPEQFRLMQVLARHPCSVRELAHMHAVSASTMSRSIDVVVQRGWVTRTPDPEDRRQVRLALSPEGRSVHAAMMAQVEEHLTERMERLDADERAELYDALGVIQRLLAGEAGEPAPDACRAVSSGDAALESRT